MRKITCILIFLVFFTSARAQTATSFDTFKKEVREHWANGDRTKSIQLLVSKGAHYTNTTEKHTIAYYLGLLYLENNNHKESFDVFKAGFERGFFFSFGKNLKESISTIPGGNEILQKNEENRLIYQKDSTAVYEVRLPGNYDSNKEYPLLYFFHGNNSSLAGLKEEWAGVDLSTDLIVVLAQSPYPRSNYAFDWIEDAQSKSTVKKIHKEISGKYKVDDKRVLVGGFSNGGRMAIDLFIHQSFPIRGFVVFSPSRPNSFNPAKPEKMEKGAIITGEKDYLLADQIQMANAFLGVSMPMRLVVFPNHGHEYPGDFSKELDTSISFLIGK